VIEALQPHDHQAASADLSDILGRAISTANKALHHKVEAAPDLAGMGTTLVAMLWSETTAVLANVGDSRAYLLRKSDSRNDGTLQMIQIIEDHVFGNLVADAASVPNLPERLTRFLDGRTDGRSPDLTTSDLRPGDRFLLCSDALSSVVANELILNALNSSSDPGQAADRLIKLATDHGVLRVVRGEHDGVIAGDCVVD
jgi:serine/threonine protein phosphatase PrpC